MARVFPSDLSKLALAGAHWAELATLALLRKRLPDDYTVFHGVHWSREYAKWTHFGEVDFVVVNRSGDVLLVEQKNGALVDGGDGLVKQYEDGDKNVNDQIRRSVDKVRQKFKWQHGSVRKLGLDYLIHCPDHRVVKVNAAALDMTRIVGAGARDGLAGRIQSVLGPGSFAMSSPFASRLETTCPGSELACTGTTTPMCSYASSPGSFAT
ncbi:MAG: nuclease-related domain-containing protein [Thiotrichales bacterium]|nr:nuclease-related domain-containing protein [Thiotrichales bacterium]